MSVQRRVTTLIVVVVGCVSAMSGAAFGLTAYQSDLSYGYDYNHRVGVCDYEKDGFGAYSDHQSFSGNWDRTYDVYGGNCSGSGYFPTGIYKHNAGEDRPWQPDSWSYYSYH